MCMTGSDLCSSQKPWANQESTAKVIYDEFYEQVLIDYKIIITLMYPLLSSSWSIVM